MCAALIVQLPLCVHLLVCICVEMHVFECVHKKGFASKKRKKEMGSEGKENGQGEYTGCQFSPFCLCVSYVTKAADLKKKENSALLHPGKGKQAILNSVCLSSHT